MWDIKTNTYYKVGGGSLGYKVEYIGSIDISASDSTVAFICGNENDPAKGLRVLYYGDTVWANENYPPLPDGVKQIEVASKTEMYVVAYSTDITKNLPIYTP